MNIRNGLEASINAEGEQNKEVPAVNGQFLLSFLLKGRHDHKKLQLGEMLQQKSRSHLCTYFYLIVLLSG